MPASAPRGALRLLRRRTGPSRPVRATHTAPRLVTAYHAAAFAPAPFVHGESPVTSHGKVFDDHELRLLVDASLDFWLTSGRFSDDVRSAGSRSSLGVRHAMLCNSGSSANLLAVSALTSERLGKRRLQPGDEVITVAAGFPTTVNAILQNQLVPVFLDVELGTYDVKVEQLAEAVGPRTKAVFIAHTLGNPFDLGAVRDLCEQHRPLVARGQLRRPRRTLRRAADRDLRRHRDGELLSGAPHHDGRGWGSDGEAPDAEEDRRELPRLGSRLLVRDGQGGGICGDARSFTKQPAGYRMESSFSRVSDPKADPSGFARGERTKAIETETKNRTTRIGPQSSWSTPTLSGVVRSKWSSGIAEIGTTRGASKSASPKISIQRA